MGSMFSYSAIILYTFTVLNYCYLSSLFFSCEADLLFLSISFSSPFFSLSLLLSFPRLLRILTPSWLLASKFIFILLAKFSVCFCRSY